MMFQRQISIARCLAGPENIKKWWYVCLGLDLSFGYKGKKNCRSVAPNFAIQYPREH